MFIYVFLHDSNFQDYWFNYDWFHDNVYTAYIYLLIFGLMINTFAVDCILTSSYSYCPFKLFIIKLSKVQDEFTVCTRWQEYILIHGVIGGYKWTSQC